MVSDRYGRSETNLMWRAYKDELREGRRKRAQRTAKALGEMEARGEVELEVFNDGMHFRITRPDTGRAVDLWPTTGRWRPYPTNDQTSRRGPWRKALAHLGLTHPAERDDD